MNRTFAILFYPRKSKKLDDGTVPIYLRITVDHKAVEISTKMYINPDNWISKAQKLNGTTEEVRSLNIYFKNLEQKVLSAYRSLTDAGKVITAESLKNYIMGKEEKPRMLVEIITQHNKDIQALVGKDYSKATWVKYKTTERHIREFLKWKHNVSDYRLKDLGYEFLADFEFYLKSQKNIDTNTNGKYIKNIKKIVHECVLKNWLDKDPFMAFKVKHKQTERGFLSEYELNELHEKEFDIERLNHIKDLFLFSCYTGLSYIDIYNLTRDNISIGMDGQKWVFTHRQKTETASRIPLLPPAYNIIEKYADHPKCLNDGKLLPVPSNQKVNAYLKEIADCCGIKKQLTFHIARHTFATTVTLSNGVPIESVSKMLGHKKIQTTQHYAKILDRKVSDDMEILRKKYSNKNEPLKSLK